MRKLFKAVLAFCAITTLFASMAVFIACDDGKKTDIIKYGIIVEGCENGTIISSTTEAEEGMLVMITVTPDSGYKLGELRVDVEVMTVIDNTYIFAMPAKAVTVSATFVEDVYSVLVDEAGKGTVSVSKTSAAPGEVITVTVTPDSGYKLGELQVDGKAVMVMGNTYTFTMPAKAVTVNATFVEDVYSVLVNEAGKGTVSVSKTSAAPGEVITVTVTPDSGYKLSELKVDGEAVTVTDNTYTFSMPAKDVTVNGTFVENVYAVRVAGAENGTVSVSKSSAAPGETITVTVTPDFGYALGTVTVNGAAATVSGNTATFTMPEADAEIDVTFTSVAITAEAVPSARAFEISVKALAGATANSYWTVAFGESAVTVAAYVEDEAITNRDAVAVYFGKSGIDGVKLSSANIGMQIAPAGEATGYLVTNGSYTEGEVQITATAVPWGEQADTMLGYKVTFEVAYTALGFEGKADAQGSLTVLPILFNTDSTYAPREGTIENGEAENPGSYPVFSADNTWEENYYALGIGQLGDGNAVSAGRYWDLEKDYAIDDSENYANREAKLTGHDGVDNDIVFFRSEGNALFAKATFRVDDVLNGEKWGKFGLMLFDGASKTGVFFYADASIGEGKTISVDNISGTSLGYNVGNGNWGSWVSIPDSAGSFNLETHTITLAMVYYENMIYMYCGDTLVEQIYYATKTGDLQIGMKSLAYTLTVTDYTSSDDPREFADYIPDVEQETVDVLFAGDSYMEFLINYGCYESLTSEIATKANEGVGGTQVPYWQDDSVVKMLEKFYDPAKIVFHIGVNDVDDASRSVDEIYADLVELFGIYNTTFPDAQIYWVSLIPNMLFANKTSDYLALNAKVQTFAQSTEYLNYIDVTTAFSAGEDALPTARANMFVSDGLHLNAEYGYPLWMKVIKEALGYTVATGDTFGYNASGFMPTGGWTYGEGTASNTGTGEAVTYYKDIDLSADIYLQAEIKKGETYNSDPYPKVGLILRNDKVTLFAFLDTNPADIAKGNLSIVARPLFADGKGRGDWKWEDMPSAIQTNKNCEQDYVTIGFGKIGAWFFITVDGVKVLEWQRYSLEATDTFVAGITGFNSQIDVRNAIATNVTAEVQAIYENTGAGA